MESFESLPTYDEFTHHLINMRNKLDTENETTAWDSKCAALIVPCFDELEQVNHTVASINSEIEVFHSKSDWSGTFKMERLVVFFIVDGAKGSQIQTALYTINAIKDEFVNRSGTSNLKLLNPNDGLKFISETISELTQLKELAQGISEDEEWLEEHQNASRQHREERLTKLESSFNAIFSVHEQNQNKERVSGNSSTPSSYLGYDQYHTRLLHYKIQMESKAMKFHRATPLSVDFHVFVKEFNRQKKDTLFLAMFLLMRHVPRPLVTAFVDCDTSWKGSSLCKMYNKLLMNPQLAGVSGALTVRNSHWYNPLTSLQEFTYTYTQIGVKEAESVVGMVTCMPGAFSAVRIPVVSDIEILRALIAHPKTLHEKNGAELGEDRFWTTLVLHKCVRVRDGPRGVERIETTYEIEHIRTARALTCVPDAIIPYILQQRRWINSTLANQLFLLPQLQASCCRCYSFSHFVGTMYLLFRTFLEILGYFLAPSILGIFILTMLVDVGASESLSVNIPIGLLFSSLLVVLLWPQPRKSQYAVCYRILIWTETMGMSVLVVWWLCKVGIMLFSDAEISGLTLARFILVLSFFGAIILLGILHGEFRGILSPFWKPILYLGFTPMTFITIPAFSFANLHDFSWGNRESSAAVSKGEQRETEQSSKQIFFSFVVSNIILYSACRFASSGVQEVMALVLFIYIVSLSGSTIILSILASFFHFYNYCKKYVCRRTGPQPRATAVVAVPAPAAASASTHPAVAAAAAKGLMIVTPIFFILIIVATVSTFATVDLKSVSFGFHLSEVSCTDGSSSCTHSSYTYSEFYSSTTGKCKTMRDAFKTAAEGASGTIWIPYCAVITLLIGAILAQQKITKKEPLGGVKVMLVIGSICLSIGSLLPVVTYLNCAPSFGTYYDCFRSRGYSSITYDYMAASKIILFICTVLSFIPGIMVWCVVRLTEQPMESQV